MMEINKMPFSVFTKTLWKIINSEKYQKKKDTKE